MVVVVVVMMVMMMMGWSSKKSPRDLARGVGRWGRRATVSGGGRLVVHWGKWLVVCGRQWKGM